MFKKVGLFYFSGTGNTKVVSELIMSYLIAQNVEIDVFAIDELIKQEKTVNLEQYDLIGFGYPILGLGCPPIMINFLKQLPSYKCKAFIYMTAADYISLNYHAAYKATKILKNKKINVFYQRIIVMGCNFLIPYDDDFNKQLYLVAIKKVDLLCKDILIHKKRILPITMLRRIFTPMVMYGEGHIGARLFGLSLYAKTNCNKCGICVKNCPSRNIHFKYEKVKFGSHCEFCMKCIYGCPQNAIFNRLFSLVILKKGYNIRNIINDTNLKGTYLQQEKIGRYYQHYRKYIENEEL